MTGGQHAVTRIVKRHPRTHDAGRPGAAIGLEHVAVEGHLLVREDRQVCHGAQAPPDQALNLLGPA